MTFEEMKKIVVDTLSCDEDKVTILKTVGDIFNYINAHV